MFINLIIVVNFIIQAIMVMVYFRYNFRERKILKQQSGQALELQQRIYQIQILKEIGERIGYSLDTSKIVEIIMSSVGNLLDYDTASYIVLEEDGNLVFKCHVENSISHSFIEDVKAKMLLAIGAILDKKFSGTRIDERITGTILDDNINVNVASYFNLPVIISGKFVGLINVATKGGGMYGDAQASILYSITNQAATAVSKLQAVLESEKGRLASIITSMTDGVLMVTTMNQVLVSNPAVKQLLGISSNQDTTMFDVVDALAGKIDIRTKIEESIAKHQPIKLPEVILKDYVVEMTITPVRNRDGENLGAAVVLHDVTTEKSLEKLRQEFTAMMVHELRAPLTAVRWSSESLGKTADGTPGVDPLKVKESANTIAAASKNMLALVNDLLDVAKIEAGKFDLNIQEYDIVDIIKEQAKTFEAHANSKHLQMSVSVPDKFMLKCDKVRVSQALENLISNAIKYSDSGEIVVSFNPDLGKKVGVVAVKDSGVGVSREDLSNLFSKFRQLKNVDNSRKGTGLGLVVTKGIVDAHGGKIWAESPGENMGTTFYFTIPL